MTCVYPCPIKSDMFELSQHAASEASYTHNQSLVRDLSSKWTEDLPVKTEQTAAHFIRKKPVETVVTHLSVTSFKTWEKKISSGPKFNIANTQ